MSVISEKLHSVPQKHRLLVLFTSEFMHKKHKRVLNTPPDLLARFCKLVEQQKSAWFFILASLFDKGIDLQITTCKLAANEDYPAL